MRESQVDKSEGHCADGSGENTDARDLSSTSGEFSFCTYLVILLPCFVSDSSLSLGKQLLNTHHLVRHVHNQLSKCANSRSSLVGTLKITDNFCGKFFHKIQVQPSSCPAVYTYTLVFISHDPYDQ